MEEAKPAIGAKGIAIKAVTSLADIAIAQYAAVYAFCIGLADAALFMWRAMLDTFSRDFELREFFYQCYSIGYKSLPLISVTGTIMGLVLTIQSRPVMISFGAVGMLPGMVAVSLVN